MEMPRILIGAIKSGSGKTTITCGLLQALKNRKANPRSFKCGPDYIDPMFHERVIGIPSRNLDTFFSGKEEIVSLFMNGAEKMQISVLEGVMGLFDGLGGTREEGSAYHLAKTLQIPIILVLDAKGMGRTMIPVLSGILQYDTQHLIQGVILNRTSKSFADVMRPIIEKKLHIDVLGAFPEQKEMSMSSRHLGLVLPQEIPQLQKQLDCLAEQLEQYVDINRIISIAKSAKEIEKGEEIVADIPCEHNKVRIAVAKDEAFCFIYEDNMRLLEKFGAEIVEFSPLHDKNLPEKIQGIILPGGYPELYAKELSENKAMRSQVAELIRKGIPSLAECGGFMYLHEEMTDEEGNIYPMVGIVKGRAFNTGKLVRFGYIELEEKKENFLAKNKRIKGHEFHYYDSSNNGCDAVAKKPVGKRQWECCHDKDNHFWGFPHLYYPSNSDFVYRFIEKARSFDIIAAGIEW